MLDGRRHSVDIPISRALLALRRVRSLRDPTTNSLGKFHATAGNVDWETNSNDGLSLKFVSGCQEGGSDKDSLCEFKSIHIDGRRETQIRDYERHIGLTKTEPIPSVNSDSGYCELNKKESYRTKSMSERYCSGHRAIGLDSPSLTPPPGHCFEDMDSCNEPIPGQRRGGKSEHLAPNNNFKNSGWLMRSSGIAGDAMSRVDSPCLSGSDAMVDHCSLFSDDGVAIDGNVRGCGLKCCWSKTPEFRDSDYLSHLDDQQMLSEDVAGAVVSGQRRQGKNANNEIAPFSESPRSLHSKSIPRSFSDLIGQNMVARALISALFTEKINSFYLFHGPRGTGKTSAARIFAAALNCLSLDNQRPCGLCEECILFFSGGSRDVKEVDSVRINQIDRIRTLIKTAVVRPATSRYKVFIVDECQLLGAETWVTLLSSLDGLPQHVVFVMITADLDKLPRGALSRSQRFHFPKIKDHDVASRLGKICVKEGLEFDQVALDFIAAKANGSLRDAEMMLDQLSLLGRRITISLAHELIGIVSDDELLELLELALSADTSNTVRRARELMRSRIDPMQLTSQLANLIMDILAGTFRNGDSHVRRRFAGKYTSEVDLQKLGHALKVLSEAEKQLRTSKNQMTWLTVALVQLSSVDSSAVTTNDSSMCHAMDGGADVTPSAEKSMKYLVSQTSSKLCKRRVQDSYKNMLDSVWNRATEVCQSNTLKQFLRKRGRLSSVSADQGLAIAVLEFYHPDYVARAEKAWKEIASSLQSTLNCNVEIRINLVPFASFSNSAKSRKSSFCLFSCSRGTKYKSRSESDQSDSSDIGSDRAILKEKPVDPCSSDLGLHTSQICYRRSDSATSIRDGDGNALSLGTTLPSCSSRSHNQKGSGMRMDSFKEVENDSLWQTSSTQVAEDQQSYFSRPVRPHKRLHSSVTCKKVYSGKESWSKLDVFTPKKMSFDSYICANGSYKFCGSSDKYVDSSGELDRRKDDPVVHCCDTVTFHAHKASSSKHGDRSHWWVLPCAAPK